MVLATPTVNVIRYSALALGVVTGLYHQNKLSSEAKKNHAQAEYHRKEALIMQAKAEWTKKNLPADKKTASGDVISDPNDSRFDLEAFLQQLAAQDAKSSL